MKPLVLFAVAGVVGYVVDAGVLLALAAFAGPYLGRIASFCAAVLTTWLINRRLAFRNAASGVRKRTEFLRYFATSAGGGAVNLAIYSLLVYVFDLGRIWLPAAVAAGSLAGMLVNFSLSKRFVFIARNPQKSQPGR